MEVSESLLRAILATVARQAFPPNEHAKIVAPPGSGEKQFAAYDMCDGETPQSEIRKRLKLDSGNLSRTISRWVEAGVAIRIGADEHPMHLYALPKDQWNLRNTK